MRQGSANLFKAFPSRRLQVAISNTLFEGSLMGWAEIYSGNAETAGGQWFQINPRL
jgi:hypothetical protein